MLAMLFATFFAPIYDDAKWQMEVVSFWNAQMPQTDGTVLAGDWLRFSDAARSAADMWTVCHRHHQNCIGLVVGWNTDEVVQEWDKEMDWREAVFSALQALYFAASYRDYDGVWANTVDGRVSRSYPSTDIEPDMNNWQYVTLADDGYRTAQKIVRCLYVLKNLIGDDAYIDGTIPRPLPYYRTK